LVDGKRLCTADRAQIPLPLEIKIRFQSSYSM
jgi:hypothetical protein